MFGTEKGKAVNIMKKMTLQYLGEKNESHADFMDESSILVIHCYGVAKLVHEAGDLANRFNASSCISFKIKSSI